MVLCLLVWPPGLYTLKPLTPSTQIRLYNALGRFISRRGPIRQLRSFQGTNFVGARKELAQALYEMDQERIKAEPVRRAVRLVFLQNECSSSE